MKATIASLKFSPGHYSHVIAISKLLQQLGFETLLVVDEGYRSFAVDNLDERFAFVVGGSACAATCEFAPDLHVIFNLSTHDHAVIRALKKQHPACKTTLVYHEPYRGFGETAGSLFARSRSMDHVVRIFGRHVFSKSVLRSCDQVWLPSKSACANYASHDIRYNDSYCELPLVFTDEAGEACISAPKEYFSFISTALPVKGFSEFLSCVKGMAALDGDMKFQIVTKTDISKYLDDDLCALRDEGRLIIEHGRPHSNEAINAAYNRSVCTWFGYNASTQSGVLCKSFMFGSPGVATRVGAFEEYIDGTNGVFVDDNSDVDEVYAAYRRIVQDRESFVCAARESFLRYFHYVNYVALMGGLLESLGLAVASNGQATATGKDAR